LFFLLIFSGWLSATWGRDLSSSAQWHNLLHYQKSLTGFKSEADGRNFFLAKDGKTNPKAELEATVVALNDVTGIYGKIKAHSACVYPARKLFLEKNGYHFPKQNCEEYEHWRKGLPVTTVSLVFATAYPNNPASMFGHTFLRLNGPGEGNTLLDYVVNFAATTGEAGGVEFALLGVFGGYEGHYSIAPYFIKVNEYNHGEARDLWEYPMNLGPEAIDMLLAHLWEMEASSFFDYYFFDENCSWQILRLLEASNPKLKLSSQAPFYIIPSDTVRILKKEKLLQEPVFRPSLRKTYISLPEPKTPTQKLDKKLLYFRIRERTRKITPEQKEEYHRDLLLRSQDKTPGEKIDVRPGINRPDLGHGLRRASFTQGDGFQRVSYRLAQHDLLDQDLGHEPWSTLDVLRFTPEMRSGKVFLREATLVDVVSLNAWDGIKYEPSWFLKVGAENPLEFNCTKCLTGVFRGGLGQTVKALGDNFVTAVFISTRGYGFRPEVPGISFGMGLRGVVGFQYEKFKALLDFEKVWGSFKALPFQKEFSLSYSLMDDWALRASVIDLDGKKNLISGLSLLYYY
jgi:Domain of unknown function (DUF4105)